MIRMAFTTMFFIPLVAIASPNVQRLGSGEWIQSSEISRDETYQIGDQWGKKSVNDIQQMTPVLERAILATAKVRGATGFLLGEFDGEFIIATNHHVCSGWTCGWGRIVFTELGKSFKFKKFIATFKSIDLTLFSIAVSSSEDRKQLLQVAENFNFSGDIYPEQEIITAGYGVANNSKRELMVNLDSDCRVFSGLNDFRQMADPDELNTGPDKVWSFSNGCDVSHGDSGSAMVDRQSGEVIGIIWTGKIPKSEKVRDSKYLESILNSGDEAVWKELSYAVPARKIKEVILEAIADGQFDATTQGLLESILSN